MSEGRPGWGEEPPPEPHIWHTLAYRVAFCSADLYDTDGTLLASARCTQIIRRG